MPISKECYLADEALITARRSHIKRRLAARQYAREIEFPDSLPMRSTGKITRRELRVQHAARTTSTADQ